MTVSCADCSSAPTLLASSRLPNVADRIARGVPNSAVHGGVVEAPVEFAWVEQAEGVRRVFEGDDAGDVFDHAAFFDHVAVRIGDPDADLLTERDHGVDLAWFGGKQRRQAGRIQPFGNAHELNVIDKLSRKASLELVHLLESAPPIVAEARLEPGRLR